MTGQLFHPDLGWHCPNDRLEVFVVVGIESCGSTEVGCALETSPDLDQLPIALADKGQPSPLSDGMLLFWMISGLVLFINDSPSIWIANTCTIPRNQLWTAGNTNWMDCKS